MGIRKSYRCDLIKEFVVINQVLMCYLNSWNTDTTHISFPFMFDQQEDVIKLIQLFPCVPRCGADRDQHYILQHWNQNSPVNGKCLSLLTCPETACICGCTQKTQTGLTWKTCPWIKGQNNSLIEHNKKTNWFISRQNSDLTAIVNVKESNQHADIQNSLL